MLIYPFDSRTPGESDGLIRLSIEKGDPLLHRYAVPNISLQIRHEKTFETVKTGLNRWLKKYKVSNELTHTFRLSIQIN